MSTIQYITSGYERWDTIAFKAYGNAALSEVIIKANPEVDITDILAPGIILDLPILEGIEAATDIDLLPPWKR